MLEIMKMIALYLAISHVSISMHPKYILYIENSAIDTLRFVLDVTQRIRSGANSGHSRGLLLTFPVAYHHIQAWR